MMPVTTGTLFLALSILLSAQGHKWHSFWAAMFSIAFALGGWLK